MTKKAVVIVSGGMDSVTLLYKVIKDGYEPHVLSVNYGQRHKRELTCASKVCHKLGVEHKVVDLRSLNQLLQGSALTTSSIAVPEGHYAEPSMKQTVVPNRNMILLAVAAGWAVSLGAKEVFAGVHAGDHAIYPDCRKEFIDELNESMAIANYQRVTVKVPFIAKDKGDIVKLGLKLGVPYELTHTCYKGSERACGKCGACVERVEAFQKAGVPDPVKYAVKV